MKIYAKIKFVKILSSSRFYEKEAQKFPINVIDFIERVNNAEDKRHEYLFEYQRFPINNWQLW